MQIKTSSNTDQYLHRCTNTDQNTHHCFQYLHSTCQCRYQYCQLDALTGHVRGVCASQAMHVSSSRINHVLLGFLASDSSSVTTKLSTPLKIVVSQNCRSGPPTRKSRDTGTGSHTGQTGCWPILCQGQPGAATATVPLANLNYQVMIFKLDVK